MQKIILAPGSARGPEIAIMRKAAEQTVKEAFEPVTKILDTYEIPDEKLEQVVDYALNIFIRNKRMKPKRIARKTVDQFNLKLKS